VNTPLRDNQHDEPRPVTPTANMKVTKAVAPKFRSDERAHWHEEHDLPYEAHQKKEREHLLNTPLRDGSNNQQPATPTNLANVTKAAAPKFATDAREQWHKEHDIPYEAHVKKERQALNSTPLRDG